MAAVGNPRMTLDGTSGRATSSFWFESKLQPEMNRSQLPLGWKVYEGEYTNPFNGDYQSGWYFGTLQYPIWRGGDYAAWHHYTMEPKSTRNGAIAALIRHLKRIHQWPNTPSGPFCECQFHPVLYLIDGHPYSIKCVSCMTIAVAASVFILKMSGSLTETPNIVREWLHVST